MITIAIYEEQGMFFEQDRKITNLMLNKKQALELIEWLIEEEFEFATIPDGCNGENVNLDKIKLECLAKRIYWYQHGESYKRENLFKKNYAEMMDLCEKTNTDYDQIL